MALIFRRWVSSIPSKVHLHKPLPDNSFPIGYKLTGIHAGVKKKDILDLAVVLSTSPHPTSAAACFTRNAFKAAPVLVSDQVLTANAGRVRALVINSGCANAVTGKQGLQDAQAMVRYTSSLLPSSDENVPKIDALVMSTGVIGQTLPISNIIAGIRRAANSLGSDFAAWERAAKALMTTDTFPKLRSRIFTINNVQYRLAGMDKGAGMVHLDMGPASTSFSSPQQLHATLLGCIMTDAAVSPRSLQNALTHAVDRSFNSISVDGDMSTNDTIIIFANGAAAPIANGRIHEIDEETDRDSFEIFKKELTDFAADLAQLVVRDGEGATKFVAVNVKVCLSLASTVSYICSCLIVFMQGAPSYKDAHAIASKISTSALVKTALYGEDAKYVFTIFIIVGNR